MGEERSRHHYEEDDDDDGMVNIMFSILVKVYINQPILCEEVYPL